MTDAVYFDGIGRTHRAGHQESATQWSVKDTEYDALSRAKRANNPYFAANLTGATPSNSEWATTTYDDLNRALTITTPDGAVVTSAYDMNQVTVTDPASKNRRSITDALGRLTQVIEAPNAPNALNYQTDYGYDTLGNLLTVAQGAQNRYFFYDSLSRLVRAKNPEQNGYASLNLTNPPAYNNSWALGYGYDANGNLTSRTDARGVVSTYGYDALNRNTTIGYSDGTPAVERHYDGFQAGSFVVPNGKGRFFYNVNFTLNPATGTAGYSRTVVNSYDALGRVTAQTQGFLANDGVTWKDFASSRSYDLASHVLTQTYPSTRSVNYTYGAGGRLASASGNLGGTTRTYADTISYTPAGLLTKERFGTTTSLYHNLHYNNRLQLVDVRLGDSSTDEWTWTRGGLLFYYGTNAVNQSNVFANSPDNNGNILRQVNTVPLSGGGSVVPQRDDYTYDSLNRIAAITEAQQASNGTWTNNVVSQTFTYDRWGNRTAVVGQTAQSWSTTEAAITNRLALASGNQCTGTKNGLCYDLAGNVIFDNQLGGTGDRTYDAESRMVTATTANKYVYDADGRRVRRQVGSSQYWQVYGIGGELVAEYLWNGSTATLQKEYGSGGGASVIAESATVVRWLVTDHLGTPRIIADQAGSLAGITRHDYFPFGEENLQGAQRVGNGYQAEGVRQKFTGYERDTETSLDYAQARYYVSLQGRFSSPDPMHDSASIEDPQSWNRYSYVGNHPTTITDPTGLIWAEHRNKSGQVDGLRWFDNEEEYLRAIHDPNSGWHAISQLVYYGGNDHAYVALNPFANEYVQHLESEEDGNALIRAYADKLDPVGATGGLWSVGEMMNFLPVGRGAGGLLKGISSHELTELGVGIGLRNAAKAGAVLAANYIKGKLAERLVEKELIGKGIPIVGRQVVVMTSAGLRICDFLIRTPSGLQAIEVKAGQAVYGGLQLAKDKLIATQGGKILGGAFLDPKSALRGTVQVFDTILERR